VHIAELRRRDNREGSERDVGSYSDQYRQLDQILASRLDRPVVNKTGITGLFDFHLEFASDEARALEQHRQRLRAYRFFPRWRDSSDLKLEPAKAPGDFLAIDYVERPSAN
jgi:uncharacterized protein (TIGR03435 family)